MGKGKKGKEKKGKEDKEKKDKEKKGKEDKEKDKEKKGKENVKEKKGKAVVVEFKVSMHCNACERTVARAISKVKGVEKFVTDMVRHKVVVTGKMDPAKVLKKLRKKTGKRVEIVSNKEDSKDPPPKEENSSIDDGFPKDMITRSIVLGYCGDHYFYTMFSDENTNACSIM